MPKFEEQYVCREQMSMNDVEHAHNDGYDFEVQVFSIVSLNAFVNARVAMEKASCMSANVRWPLSNYR